MIDTPYMPHRPGSLALTERPLYGSSRLGSLRKQEERCAATAATGPDPVQQVDLNHELTDHLGNLCAVVNGRLLPGNGGGTAWQPELLGAQGYRAAYIRRRPCGDEMIASGRANLERPAYST